MTFQIITDSTSDIPPQMAKELGIRVVPIYVRFGDQLFRDGVDIQSEALYKMLTSATRWYPATSQPTPDDFAAVYKEYCGKCDGIVSIHISSKISGTCNAASIAKKAVGDKCPIEVIDSQFNSGGLALVAMYAARLAKSAKSITKLAEDIRESISRVHMFGYFDTMKYLALGGRLPRVIAAAANFMNVKPLLTFRDGEITRAGLVRSFARGAEKLYEFVKSKKNIVDMVVVHSAIAGQAEKFRQRVGEFFPAEKINIFELGAGLGVHGGPGVLLVALRVGD
jgi:DegV family protein with EDD domain